MDIGTVLDGLYASEIDAGVTVYRRGAFWWIGGDFAEECVQGTAATADEAAQAMHEAALRFYPDSVYAKRAKEATPPARVLTPEMMQAVENVRVLADAFGVFRDDIGMAALRQLRAAFGIEEA